MKKSSKAIPKFRNESEERTFWESAGNDSSEFVDWSRAQVVTFPNLRRSTQTISLRLPENLLNTIRAEAKKLDVPYQSLMKVWLAEKASSVHK
jgi:predicted DNA binding CopG/RHH family protein